MSYCTLVEALTWIHDGLRPRFLHSIPIPFHGLISVDVTTAGVICVVFGLNVTVVDVVLELKTLKHLLHFLLRASQLGVYNGTAAERTSSLARTLAASTT